MRKTLNECSNTTQNDDDDDENNYYQHIKKIDYSYHIIYILVAIVD